MRSTAGAKRSEASEERKSERPEKSNQSNARAQRGQVTDFAQTHKLQTTQTVAQQATQTASQTAARQAVRTVSQTQRLTNWVILVTGILDLSGRELFNIDEFLELFCGESDGSVDLRALEYAQRRLTEVPFQSP